MIGPLTKNLLLEKTQSLKFDLHGKEVFHYLDLIQTHFPSPQDLKKTSGTSKGGPRAAESFAHHLPSFNKICATNYLLVRSFLSDSLPTTLRGNRVDASSVIQILYFSEIMLR